MKEFNLYLLTNARINNDIQSDVILLYVLEGRYRFIEIGKAYDLEKGSIFLINSNHRYSLITLKEGILASFHFSYPAICRNLNVDYISFRCNSLLEPGSKYKELERILQSILLIERKDTKQAYQWKSRWYELTSVLIEEFQPNDRVTHRSRSGESERRISFIINYIHANYDKQISLSDLSDKLYISTSALSRFFAKEMGQSFVSYVREFRLQKVMEDLLETDKSIARIAVENGFSNPSAMNKDFKAFYGSTPSDYRKDMLAKASSATEENIKEARVREILNEKMTKTLSGDSRMLVTADVQKDDSFFPHFNISVNVGTAGSMLDDHVKAHIIKLKKEIRVDQIRIWNIFSDQMMMMDGKRSEPNFMRLDSILDFCMENRLDIIFDLSPRTNLAMASEKSLIYLKEDNYEFTSQAEWEDTIEAMMRHFLKRYGEENVNQWIFEFAFFLNEKPYYISERYRSRTVWERGYEIIKKYAPGASVAGPGIRADLDKEFISAIVEDFLGSKYKPDIFTGFYFPYEPTDEYMQYSRISDRDYLKKTIHIVRETLNEYDFKGKNIATDWNEFLGNRNYLQDSCNRGTYILKNILENYREVDGFGIWYASDLINIYYDSDILLSGSGGILSKDGICKPALYAYKFLKNMGKFEIAKGDNYVITKNNSSDVQILCFNHKELSYNAYLLEENSYKPEEISGLFQDNDICKMTVRLEHLEKGKKYIIRQRIVNESEGSILNTWINLGCVRYFTYEEIEYLRNKSMPGIRIEQTESSDGTLVIEITLMPHEMRWISVKEA